MMETKIPLVYIVILNWNGLADTLECLASVEMLAYGNFKVVVADNGSTDDSVSTIRAKFPAVTLLENGANLGFAEGNNVGIRFALEQGADYILLLNNDTVVDPSLIEHLVSAAENYPEAAMLAPKILYFKEPDKIWYAGASWISDGQYFEHDGEGEMDGPQFSTLRETDYASGCALFVRAAVAKKIGLMEPRFFLTYEESDWCYRAREAGYKCLFVPDARLWHKISASFGGVESPLQLYFYARNILLWGERHLPRAEYWRLFWKSVRDTLEIEPGAGQKIDLRRVYWNVRGALNRIRDKRPATRAKVLGLRDYILRRFGDCPAEVRSLGKRP